MLLGCGLDLRPTRLSRLKRVRRASVGQDSEEIMTKRFDYSQFSSRLENEVEHCRVYVRLYGLLVPKELVERLKHEVEKAPVGRKGWKKRAARRLLREWGE